MRSKTKYPVTQAQVRTVFAAAGLGEVSAVAPMSDGWYNTILSVTAGGADYVLKIAPHPNTRVLTYERDLLRQELRFYALLRERTKIRTPRIFCGDCSRTLLPCDYFIMEKLDGVRLDKAGLRGAARAAADAGIAEILAELHTISGAGFGYEQNGLEANWYLALRKMTLALTEDCAAFGKTCRAGARLLRFIDRYRTILEPVLSTFVHFDLHDMNLFYAQAPDGSPQLSAIDLERCFWGDRICDLLLADFFQAPERKTRLLADYNRFAKDPIAMGREEQVRYWLMMGYLAVIMHTERFSRYRPWNSTWWVDVISSVYLQIRSFAALRRLGWRFP
ncbi:MAG: aminoglycoside phosphotransferase family protein [Oscillospiraceae bacterium]|nr:aminoglycoside phosphotransferase family protein [Oscillospiraceae bacterium]